MRELRAERWQLVWAPGVAAALALAAALFDWRGVDLPAQLYRVDLFQRAGLTLWDSQWYGGHWTFDYSVIFPPVAGLLGVYVTAAVSAAAAAWMFDRIAVGHFGASARVGSLIFAVGTLAQVAIGQLPFLLGEALALSAAWAATRRQLPLASALATAAALASPLAGGFLALAALAWLLAQRQPERMRALLLIVFTALPVLALAALFPGEGAMPFPALDFGWLVALFGAFALLVPRDERALRIGAGLYVLAVAASFAVANPIGGNISRLGECLGTPLAACVLWPARRRLLVMAVVPLVLLQWMPALATFGSDKRDPSTHAAYFAPLIAFLQSNSSPAGRVEVVPTKLHWEAAYVAPAVPLARGWERQLDTADNAVFYTVGALTPASYRAWLIDNGVRYVALELVWRNAHWRVLAVRGARGIVDGPARLVALDGGAVTLDATRPGNILVRVRYSPRWSLVQGAGCVASGPDGWTEVEASHSGELQLALQLVGAARGSC
jgi:hypothetical protein